MSNDFRSSADERIWQVVAAIPEGAVATYGQVAELAELPNGARAVGNAMSRLPKGSSLPWHRVVNARGAISPAGDAGRRQRQLLRDEGHRFKNGRLDLRRSGWLPDHPLAERNRIDRVTTKTGDSGTTSLADGRRYRKFDARIELVGELDEANSVLGLLAEEVDAELAERLRGIQSRLFDAGAVAATGAESVGGVALDWQDLAAALAAETQHLNSALEPLREFILPGGGRASSIAHLARAVVRRAERAWWRASDDALRDIAAGIYLNRLSDYLFVLARTVAREERQWRRAL